MEEAAKLFQALSETSRLRLLKCLQIRPACVCELMQATGMSQTRVSRHLSVLKAAGLVEETRSAQWVIHSLAEPPPDELSGKLLALVADRGEDNEQVIKDRERLATATCTRGSQPDG